MISRRSGFTILELLVASTLMGLMVLTVLGLTRSILNGWNRTADNTFRSLQAQAVFDLLASDLAGAILAEHEGQGTFVLEVAEAIHGFSGGTALRFFSSSAGRSTEAGSVQAVAWFLAVNAGESPFIDEQVPSLFRATLDPGATWQAWAEMDRPRSLAGLSVPLDLADSFLLAHCVAFRAEAWGRSAQGELVRLDALSAAPFASVGDTLLLPVPPVEGSALVTPAFVDVSLRVLTPRAAATLKQQRRTGEIADFDEAAWIKANSALFVRRLRLGPEAW